MSTVEKIGDDKRQVIYAIAYRQTEVQSMLQGNICALPDVIVFRFKKLLTDRRLFIYD